MKYCNSLNGYSRWKTREVKVGSVGIGGSNPLRVQSMTTTDTMDVAATVAQSIRMIEAGCELVRITAPSLKEAQNLLLIKNELRKAGFNTPLVADIHFTPNAAELAAKIVEKVRVNPGNYADKKKFETIEYTDDTYASELNRIRERFLPLVKICKEHGTAMRIGTNHGSLSDRIMSRFGDTPAGMVESALEFVRICRDENFHELVLSMKASNPIVMVQAYRLLVNRMMEEGMNYPLHLGVTEAGEGEDGRIKSAVGIGTLLEDGLGDTIRVSLTEEPEEEIPVARMLADRYDKRKEKIEEDEEVSWSPYEFQKRETFEVLNTGGKNFPRVIADVSFEEVNYELLKKLGYKYSSLLDKWNLSDQAADYIYVGKQVPDIALPGTLSMIVNFETWEKLPNRDQKYPLVKIDDYKEGINSKVVFVEVFHEDLEKVLKLKGSRNVVLVLNSDSELPYKEWRKFFFVLYASGLDIPVVLRKNYVNISAEQLQLFASIDVGGLQIDGFGDGVWLSSKKVDDIENINRLSFGILQATRSRISKTEYISCPSCGRTLFNLQETTARIRLRTSHLKGVKIGIMGCIVNGPGEMADADYGYVGTGIGKITLYKGREVVKRNIPSEEAVDALIDLIKLHGDWIEPEVVEGEVTSV